VPDDELVERRAGGDEDREATGSPPGPAELLPGGGDRARVAHEDRRLEAADVDAELECIGRHDSRHLARAEAGLDLAPVKRQVAAAIAPHPADGVEPRRQVLLKVAQHHLDLEPAAAEDDGLHAGPDPRRGDPARLQERAPPHAQGSVQQRRVVEDQPPLATRGAALIDERDGVLLQQAVRQLGGIGDRRRGADEARRGPVEGTDALQAADDVRDLAAEDAAIRVQLVDDDVLEAGEELPPSSVVGKDPGVEHVRVGQHHVAGVPDHGAPPGRCVAVVGVAAEVDSEAGAQGAELGQLVLRERLGRKEVERAALGALEDPLEDR
jgi:hypothetical protein